MPQPITRADSKAQVNNAHKQKKGGRALATLQTGPEPQLRLFPPAASPKPLPQSCGSAPRVPADIPERANLPSRGEAIPANPEVAPALSEYATTLPRKVAT